jgi:hypothetical protein
MTTVNHVNTQDEIYESTRNEILCMDIMKTLRPTVEQYAMEVRRFSHTLMIRGFDRHMIGDSVAVFLTEIYSLIAMVDDYLEALDSPESRLIENEMKSIKTSIEVIIKTVEKIILERPVINMQLFLDSGRIE